MTVLRPPPWLAAELADLDHRLRRAVLAMRVRRPLSRSEFAGLEISDAEINAALATEGWTAPPPLPPHGSLPGPETPFQRIVRRFDLDAAERHSLVIGLAPQFDRRYDRVFAYLNDAMTATAPTIDLALRVLDGVPGVACALAPGGRLHRLGLIEVIDPRHPAAWRARSFIASEILALSLMGAGPEALALPARPIAATQPDPAFAAALHDAAPLPLIAVTGRPGAGRTALAAGIIAALGRQPLRLDAIASLDPTTARRLALAAALHPIGLVLPEGATAGALLDHWPDDAPLALIAADRRAAARFAPGRRLSVAAVPEPDAAARAALWHAATGCTKAAAARLGHAFPLTAAEIRRAADLRDPGPNLEAALLAGARQVRTADFGQLAQRLDRLRGWGELVLPRAAQAALDDVATAVLHRRLVLVDWGFEHLAQGGALTALFSGPSGTGKTMAAGALAARAGLDLWRIDLSAVVDKYIGETEKHLERIFAAAAETDAVLLFDEADALFGKRAETRDARDRYANQEVSYLLQRIESLPAGIVVVLTTNLAKNMDTAFLRRLTHHVDFPRPTAALRRRIWEGVFPAKAPRDPSLDLDAVAAGFDLAGGEIRQVALDAAFRAAGDACPIAMPHLAAALRRHYEKLGRSAPAHAIAALTRPHPVLAAQ